MIKPRILVVDNDAAMVETLRVHLEHNGLETVTTTGGEAALAALASQEFDVVLTDLVMDEVDGLTCCGGRRPRARGRASSS